MAYDPVTKLNELIVSFQPGVSVPKYAFLEMLRLTRLLLDTMKAESDNRARSFPTLRLYCDWIMHTEMDRNPGAFKILERTDQVIVNHGNDMPAFHRHMREAFGFANLRSEIVLLLKYKNIPGSLFAVEANFQLFLTVLLDDLVARPIMYPDDIATNLRARGHDSYQRRIEARTLSRERIDLIVVGLEIRMETESVSGRPAGFYWEATLFKHLGQSLVKANGHLA